MTRFVLAMCLAASALATTACNTVRGVGRDVESVADAADRAT